MACTSFSTDKTVKCDHESSGDTLLIELPDDADEYVIEDSVLRELAAEAKAKPAAKCVDDEEMSAGLAAGQLRNRFYNDVHRRSREQDDLWAQIEHLHRTLKPRPHGQRRVFDFGIEVPPAFRYLTY